MYILRTAQTSIIIADTASNISIATKLQNSFYFVAKVILKSASETRKKCLMIFRIQ